MMQLKWGDYPFNAGGVRLTSKRAVQRDAAGTPYLFVDAVTADGYIEADGQAALTLAQLTLQEALKKPFQDLVFLCDDGSQSATVLTNSQSVSGVYVVDGPHFEDTAGNEYVNRRHFKFTAEGDFRMPRTTAGTIIEWKETVQSGGGGPLYVTKPAIEGPPQRQKVYDQTVWTASQRGYAVGFGDYPDAPTPIWPFALVVSPNVTRAAPDRAGVDAGRRQFWKYRVDWEFKYEWPETLVGVPSLWP